MCISIFFFFKQKTAYEMRISDWSSDVCSSDLVYNGDAEVSVETGAGRVLERRPSPRAVFDGMAREYPWDLLHLAYFCGYAGWNYLTTPFLFTYPGFETEEIEPWEEEGEIWRRLKVRFSPDIPTHCPEQIFHFDAKGLLRQTGRATW